MKTMTEQQFANRIRQVLDRGTELDAATARKLRAARDRAVAARRSERVSGLVWADNVLGGVGGLGGFSLRFLLPAALVALSVAAIYAWQQKQQQAQIEEIDSALLVDDLPIDAYLDRGFEAWLKKQQRAAR